MKGGEVVNERLKELRNSLNFSQEEFGDRVGIKSRAHISLLENGTRNLTDRVVSDICREFNVNEDWLRDGQGEMFVESDSSLIEKLSREYDLDSIDVSILKAYLNLIPEHRKVVKEFLSNITNSVDETLEDNQNVIQEEEDPIEKELNAYRLELDAEKKGEISAASDDINDHYKNKEAK